MPPSSNQNPQGNSKAAKFVAANPLAPLADPFSGLDSTDAELHTEVSNNVQKRLEKAMEELKEKHRTGTNEIDDVDRAPTGAAYKALHRQQREAARQLASSKQLSEERQRTVENEQIKNVREQLRRLKFEKENDDNYDNDGIDNNNNSDDSDDDDDSEYDHLLEDDNDELTSIRMARLAQLKAQQTQHATNLSLGHGQLRTITESEFLSECTGSSKYVIVHYYNDEFERCKIMDFHLKIVAEQHVEAKFLRLDATKAPFFVSKFRVRTLPTLFVYEEGKEIGRLIGFDGLTSGNGGGSYGINNCTKKADEWHTGKLQEWLASTGAIKYEKPTEEIEEEMKRMGMVVRGAVYSSNSQERSGVVDDDYY